MAVLAEAISVIIRVDSIFSAFDNWDHFLVHVPNRTLCADGDIARIGFMAPQDVQAYVKSLEKCGVKYLDDGWARDLVVVDQQRGPLARCGWIDFGHVDLDGNPARRVAACRLKGSTGAKVITPDGWEFEGSLSQTFGFVPAEHVGKALRLLRDEDGLEVYESKLTGTEVYVGRPHIEDR